MKTWLTLGVLGTAVAAAAGLSSLKEVPQVHEPTDAEVAAHVDARLHQVMHTLLASEHSDALTAAAGR